jgi:hypothetical protein
MSAATAYTAKGLKVKLTPAAIRAIDAILEYGYAGPGHEQPLRALQRQYRGLPLEDGENEQPVWAK